MNFSNFAWELNHVFREAGWLLSRGDKNQVLLFVLGMLLAGTSWHKWTLYLHLPVGEQLFFSWSVVSSEHRTWMCVVGDKWP